MSSVEWRAPGFSQRGGREINEAYGHRFLADSQLRRAMHESPRHPVTLHHGVCLSAAFSIALPVAEMS